MQVYELMARRWVEVRGISCRVGYPSVMVTLKTQSKPTVAYRCWGSLRQRFPGILAPLYPAMHLQMSELGERGIGHAKLYRLSSCILNHMDTDIVLHIHLICTFPICCFQEQQRQHAVSTQFRYLYDFEFRPTIAYGCHWSNNLNNDNARCLVKGKQKAYMS
jgi:hypothetical protein